MVRPVLHSAIRRPGAGPFSGKPFSAAWWKHLSGGRTRIEEAGPALVDLLCAYGSPVGPRIVSTIGHGVADFLDPGEGGASEPELDQFLKQAAGGDWGDALLIPRLDAASASGDRILALARRAGLSVSRTAYDVAPYIRLAESWEDYQTRRSNKTWSRLRRQRRRLNEMGGLALQAVTSEVELEAAFPELFRIYEARAESSYRGPLWSDAVGRRFLMDWMRGLLGEGTLDLTLLRVTGTAIAFCLGVRKEGGFYHYATAFDPRHPSSRYAPGELLTEDVIRRAHEADLTWFDFMVGAESYKFAWSATSRPVESLVIGRSTAVVRLVSAGLAARQAIRTAAGRLPHSLRRAIRHARPRGVWEGSGGGESETRFKFGHAAIRTPMPASGSQSGTGTRFGEGLSNSEPGRGGMRAKVLFVCNNPDFFASQHMYLAETARMAGFEVAIATPAFAGVDRIEAAGFEHHRVKIARGGLKPVTDAMAVVRLYRLYRRIRPDLIYHITLKPILYGTIAARLAKIPAVVNANTGLGYAFIDSAPGTTMVRGAFEYIYRRAIRHRNRRDLFLNHDDRDRFISFGLTREAISSVITGPGVCLKEFTLAQEVSGRPLVILPARLLWHKGLREFVDAARILKARGLDARFALVGDVDSGNPATAEREQLRAWDREGTVEWWGFSSDMPAVYRQAHVVTLPSYREGLGKVLAEAGATGRAVVATDVPGCREIVSHGVNGLLVPPRNAQALAAAIARLLADPKLREQLGSCGRREVEERFAEPLIAAQTLAVMKDLLDRHQEEPRMARTAPAPDRPRSLSLPLSPAPSRPAARVAPENDPKTAAGS